MDGVLYSAVFFLDVVFCYGEMPDYSKHEHVGIVMVLEVVNLRLAAVAHISNPYPRLSQWEIKG